MTAHRITAERIAELKRHYPRGAYSQNRKHHPFGHIAYSTININELIDALESAYAELDRLRSAPVAVGAQGTPGYEWRSTLDRMPMDTWLICSNQDARLFWAKQAPRSGQWTFGGVGFRDPTHWLAPRLSLSPQPSAPVAVEVPWISVEDRLPEDGQSVAFVTKCDRDPFYHGRVLGGRYTAGEFGGFSVPGLMSEASHWLALPPPPVALRSKGGE